jgi:putative ABC transport system permease protein
MLSNQFLKTVLIQFFLSVPLAWFGMNKWLEGFAYRVEVDLLVVASSVFFILLISILTISYQSLKAAYSNPVESLKYQ